MTFMFKLWDGSCKDRDCMLNTTNDVLGIFEWSGLLEGLVGLKYGFMCDRRDMPHKDVNSG